MPYIMEARRAVIDPTLDPLRHKVRAEANEGEMNYVITRLLDAWLAGSPRSYTMYNAAIGILEAAKLELYRRMVAPYEDTKLAVNGEVYIGDGR